MAMEFRLSQPMCGYELQEDPEQPEPEPAESQPMCGYELQVLRGGRGDGAESHNLCVVMNCKSLGYPYPCFCFCYNL